MARETHAACAGVRLDACRSTVKGVSMPAEKTRDFSHASRRSSSSISGTPDTRMLDSRPPTAASVFRESNSGWMEAVRVETRITWAAWRSASAWATRCTTSSDRSVRSASATLGSAAHTTSSARVSCSRLGSTATASQMRRSKRHSAAEATGTRVHTMECCNA